jgi:hypothetical protein
MAAPDQLPHAADDAGHLKRTNRLPTRHGDQMDTC